MGDDGVYNEFFFVEEAMCFSGSRSAKEWRESVAVEDMLGMQLTVGAADVISELTADGVIGASLVERKESIFSFGFHRTRSLVLVVR